MSCEVVIRSARAADLEQRSELVRRGFSAYFWDAFLFFFFQESVRGECFGLVAEVRGAGRGARGGAGRGAGRGGALRVRVAEDEAGQRGYAQVVGTVSVSEYWGAHDRGWLHALSVHPDWRCRGAYERPLLGAALTLPLLPA